MHTLYLADRDTRLQIRDDTPFFFVCLALQQDRDLRIEGLGPVLLKEGQFNFIYSPRFDLRSTHKAGKEYSTVSLRYPIPTLEAWAGYFPLLHSFLEKIQAGSPAVLLEGNGWITREIQDLLYQFLHTSKDLTGFPVYFNLMARTILFQLLQQSLQHQPASPYTHYEITGLHAARDIIRKNIRQHLAIPDIARQVGLNEFKLKAGFRELFGNGLYAYLQTERMEAALRLLDDPHHGMKEIAEKAGYKSVNSFTKAFRKKFGTTPGEYRKRQAYKPAP